MKHSRIMLLAIAVAFRQGQAQTSGSAAGEVLVSPAEAPSAADVAAAYSGRMSNMPNRVVMLQRYVRWIESRLPKSALSAGNTPLTMVSTNLPPNAFADVTDEQWARMDAFFSGRALKRLRLLPPPGMKPKTEEFYFDDGKLVYVYISPDGANKRDPHVENGGEAFYFGKEGLFAWIRPDGKTADSESVAFKAWGAKLLAEANRFAREAKSP